MQIIDGFPRRCRIDHYTKAEQAISKAVQAVESVGCDTLLTDAVILLGEAKEKVADYVERGHEAEQVILEAIKAVRESGYHPLLSEAADLLDRAKNKVLEFTKKETPQ